MSTKFFQELENNMKNRQSTTKKFYLYSAHDTTIAGFLGGFKLTSTECIFDNFGKDKPDKNCIIEYPGFASNLIIELREKDSELFVYMKYNGTD